MRSHLPLLRAGLAVLTALLASHSSAETSKTSKIPAALLCGQSAGNPPTFADKITFDFSNGVLTAVRPTRLQKGTERYRGSVDASGKIKISGVGHYDDKSFAWTSEYSGQLDKKQPTAVYGSMNVKGATAWVSKCKIGFLLPPAELTKVFASAEAAAQPLPPEPAAQPRSGEPSAEAKPTDAGAQPKAAEPGAQPKSQ